MRAAEFYSLIPQMKVYDSLPSITAPYVTFISRPGFRSEVVNTDERGFRRTVVGSLTLDSSTWWDLPRRGVVLGGSFAFGWGATRDEHTLPSALSVLTGHIFLNLGIRGGNSTQELVSSIPFLTGCRRVVICSGINNLTVNLQSLGLNELFAPFFFEENYEALTRHAIWELESLLSRPLRAATFGSLLGEVAIRLKSRIIRRAQTMPDQPLRLDDAKLQAAACRALEIQSRDLHVLRAALPPDTSIVFAAQPFAPTCVKKWSPEEQRLFALSDRSSYWRSLRDYLVDLWPAHVVGLKTACRNEGMDFLDLNQAPFDGWCFVDAVHMTDQGYRQSAEEIVKQVVI